MSHCHTSAELDLTEKVKTLSERLLLISKLISNGKKQNENEN